MLVYRRQKEAAHYCTVLQGAISPGGSARGREGKLQVTSYRTTSHGRLSFDGSNSVMRAMSEGCLLLRLVCCAGQLCFGTRMRGKSDESRWAV